MGAFCTSLSATTRTAAASATRPKASQHGSPPLGSLALSLAETGPWDQARGTRWEGEGTRGTRWEGERSSSLSRSNHEAHNTALSLVGSTGDEMLAFRDRWLQRNRILKGRSHHSIGASSDQRCGSIWSLPLVITSGREEMSTSGVPAVGSTHERARHERTTSPGSLPVSAPLAWVIDGCGLLGRRRSFDLIVMSAGHNHGFMEDV
ncbi:hypothetical protein B296_00011250 [Ensete ventricosum]|uniref:Uncharacterized protein n=1 Tax=Ensete ventricosum TaxID=4639 RepID=A0A426YQ14_ENSVE|nr:hypothetical protein B296_00011250 [Ensete ventricosum]